MFRVFTFLIVILLFFSTMPVSLAQQQTPQAQAEADASADMSDMSKAKWFLLGGVGSTAGCLLGCISGSLLGGPTYESTNSQAYFMLVGSVLCGVCAVPIAVFRYPHTVMPPPERFLGKSAEYIEAYTQAYKSRTVLLRKIFVTAGSITSNLGVMTLIARFGFGE
jgi:hypothetical protein